MSFLPAITLAADPLVKSVEVQTVKKGRDGGTTWFHPRGCTLPDGTVLWTMQSITGSDHFGPVQEMTTTDRGKTWSEPKPIAGFDRKKMPNGTEAGVCDVVPEYHAATNTVLAIGQTVNYKNEKFFVDQPARWPVYCVRDKSGHWSDAQQLVWDDPRGAQIYSCNCAQRITLANGDVLIPITFGSDLKKPRSVTTFLCHFDGKSLTVKKVGTELRGKVARGFLEPSLALLDGVYFMTIRAEDNKGYVSTSKDGLEWSEPTAWSWNDDGTLVAMSTTQQRWMPHSDDLYLVYTRKNEENAAVMRWRTPLYMAKVDRKTLRLIRESERIAVPMTDDPAKGPSRVAHLGNFHTQAVTAEESWITVGEVIPANWKGDLLLARVMWAKTNKLAPQ